MAHLNRVAAMGELTVSLAHWSVRDVNRAGAERGFAQGFSRERSVAVSNYASKGLPSDWLFWLRRYRSLRSSQ